MRTTHDNLPTIARRGGGTLMPGRHIAFDEVPLSNLPLPMLHRQGVKETSFGDSTGVLQGWHEGRGLPVVHPP